MGQALRLFLSVLELKGLSRRFAYKPLGSKQDLEAYKRFRVEEHVYNIIAELYKFLAVYAEFGLGNRIQFSNHANSLSKNETFKADIS